MGPLKPANIIVDREDYNWMILRFGNSGVRPGAGELTKRERAYILHLENALESVKSELAEINRKK